MSQTQPKPCCNNSLKHSCILLGSLNALISLVLLAIMSYLTIIFAVFNYGFNDGDPGPRIYPLYVLTLVVTFILLIKLTLDILFVYAVVQKRVTIIRVYFFTSLAICIFITAFVIYESVINANVGFSLGELIFYSLDIVTIFLSYFYSKELTMNARDDV